MAGDAQIERLPGESISELLRRKEEAKLSEKRASWAQWEQQRTQRRDSFGVSNRRKSTANSSGGDSGASTPAESRRSSHSVLGAAKGVSGTATGNKRPAEEEGRKISMSTLPKMKRKNLVASPQSSDRASSASGEDGIETTDEQHPPKWYVDLKAPQGRKALADDAGALPLLENLRDEIKKGNVIAVREKLHQCPFTQVNEVLLKKTRTLDAIGLPAVFDGTNPATGQPWPYDVCADAKELYNKWCRKIFAIDLLRGIQLHHKAAKKDGSKKGGDSIIPGYAGKVKAQVFGENGLLNGQWFPLQLTTVRDGAHGATQGGISGKQGEGAYSCIMAGDSGYPDIDNGDEVRYCGTDSTDGTVTDRTQMLMDNMNNDRPVRFIRRANLHSQWAPTVGYRYDGLYDVKDFEVLKVIDNPRAARHRFRLVRREGQDPIRGGKGPEARPTEQEIARYQEDKRFR